MDWSMIVDEAWFQVLLTIVGLIVGSALALQWGNRNGYALGRRVGQWLPGDPIEQWLVEFLQGLREGLESTYTEATVETKTEASFRLPEGVRTGLKIDVKPNLLGAELPPRPEARPGGDREAGQPVGP